MIGVPDKKCSVSAAVKQTGGKRGNYRYHRPMRAHLCALLAFTDLVTVADATRGEVEPIAPASSNSATFGFSAYGKEKAEKVTSQRPLWVSTC